MADAMVVEWIKDKYQALRAMLNERSRRLWAAVEARSLGRGGVAAVIAATGMSSATGNRGLEGVGGGASGGWGVLAEPTARGDPEHPLRWTCKSTSKLAAELRKQGFHVGPRTVAKELAGQDFSFPRDPQSRGRA